ncbi:MAG: DNA polymerase III subunit epsilon [Pseudomonadota bacterium]
MREVVLDTETTGLDVLAGHRIVEIGCVELVNHVPTGNTFQRYLNPDRANEREAFEVHGLSDSFLSRQMRFREVADDLMDFLADSPLIIHNAAFDLGFLNFELEQAGHPRISGERVVDSLELARRTFPGQANSLDALMRRFEIDATARTHHGALLDAELLAQVYLELRGGRQQGLGFGPAADDQTVAVEDEAEAETTVRDARPHEPTAQELAAHEAFLDNLNDPIWRRS